MRDCFQSLFEPDTLILLIFILINFFSCTCIVLVCVVCRLIVTLMVILFYFTQTPLHLAAFQGYAKCLQVLVKHGAQIRVQNAHRTTPIDLVRGKTICESILQQAIGKSTLLFTCGVFHWYKNYAFE